MGKTEAYGHTDTREARLELKHLLHQSELLVNDISRLPLTRKSQPDEKREQRI